MTGVPCSYKYINYKMSAKPTLNNTAHTCITCNLQLNVHTYADTHVYPKWLHIACVEGTLSMGAGIIIFIVFMAMNIIRFTCGHGCPYRQSSWALREGERI